MAAGDGVQKYAWAQHFERHEIWVLNTDYRLYGPAAADGTPEVSPEASHWGRLDELAKCLAVSPTSAAMRLFWYDAVISIEGPDLGEWMQYTSKRAPSEQQIIRFLWPNIRAACWGECRTPTVSEAIAKDQARCAAEQSAEAGAWRGDATQLTPGIFVRRRGAGAGQEAPEGANWWEAGFPMAEDMGHFLGRARGNPHSHFKYSDVPSEGAMGVLLDVDGAPLRFLTAWPLSEAGPDRAPDPKACVTVLGGPKGIAVPVKEALSQAFAAQGVPLVKASFGWFEEMAHACIAYVRLEDDAGRYRAALVDLLRLGHGGYRELVGTIEAELWRSRGAKAPPAKVARLPRRRKGQAPGRWVLKPAKALAAQTN